MTMKKYDQIFLRKEEEREALRECFSKPFMTAGKVETVQPQLGVFSFKVVANQLPPPDGLDLPFNLVCYEWIKGRFLTMSLLQIVDLWIHKSRLVCGSTRNCTLCCTGDSRLQITSALKKRAKTLMFRMESARIRSELPPMKLDQFQDQSGILWSTGRFDSSTKFKCEDMEMTCLSMMTLRLPQWFP